MVTLAKTKAPVAWTGVGKAKTLGLPPPFREVLWMVQIGRATWLREGLSLQLRDSAGLAPASPLSVPIRGKRHPICYSITVIINAVLSCVK